MSRRKNKRRRPRPDLVRDGMKKLNDLMHRTTRDKVIKPYDDSIKESDDRDS